MDPRAGARGGKRKDGRGGANAPREFGGYPSVEGYNSKTLQLDVRATTAANQLPQGDEYQFYSSYADFREPTAAAGVQLQRMIQQMGGHMGNEMSRFKPQNQQTPSVPDVTGQYRDMVDMFDQVYEAVDTLLDEAEGKQSTTAPPVVVKDTTLSVKRDGKTNEYRVHHASNVLRPQLKFEDKPDNTVSPFIPKLREKPNAVVPLPQDWPLTKQERGLGINAALESHMKGLGVDLETLDEAGYPHPYETELNQLEMLPNQLRKVEEQLFRPLADTKLTWVDKLDDLKEVVQKLSQESEIAIDLENHNIRSYQGFLCLMQVSTRSEDLLIDVLALRQHMYLMNEVTTNPKIVKVLHGADFDVLWLQRDFGVFIVNMFDTGQASRVLELQSFGLAYLLKHYCNVTADKQYQRADWRIRPLPNDMLKYAREDTHYLLYIYDRLKNQLIEADEDLSQLNSVWSRSLDLCRKRYAKPITTSDAHISVYNKSENRQFDHTQLAVLGAVYRWRDEMARTEDESPRYVMSNELLLAIAEMMPVGVNDLFSLSQYVSPVVRANAHEIVRVIMSGREAAAEMEARPRMVPRPEPNAFMPVAGGSLMPASAGSRSPVLSTDQLYKQARWSEMPTLSDPAVAIVMPTKTAQLAASNSNLSTARGAGALDFGEQAGSESSDEAEGRAKVAAVKSNLKIWQSPGSTQASTASAGAPTATTMTVDSTGDAPRSLDHEPESLAQIYTLSNQNRKRNKEKKKVGGQAADDGGEGEGEEKDDSDKRSKKKSKEQPVQDQRDAEAFMKNIGWMEGGGGGGGGSGGGGSVGGGPRGKHSSSGRR